MFHKETGIYLKWIQKSYTFTKIHFSESKLRACPDGASAGSESAPAEKGIFHQKFSFEGNR